MVEILNRSLINPASIDTNNTNRRNQILNELKINSPIPTDSYKNFDYDYFDNKKFKLGYMGYHDIKKFDRNIKSFANFFSLSLNDSILDYGCAKGTLLSSFLRNKFYNLTGLDISDYAIKKSNKNIKKYLYKIQMHELNKFLDRRFDLIISKDVLPHLSLKELNLLFTFFSKSDYGKIYLEIFCPNSKRDLWKYQIWDPTQKTLKTKLEWIKFIKSHRLKDVYLYFNDIFT